MDDLPPRFWDKVEMLDNGCWQWTAARGGTGYGHFKLDGKVRAAHALTYELFVGPVPDGLVLDHLCRNRACCNPQHLEAVTHKVNILRGENYCAEQARKTRCVNGHEFTPENTSVRIDSKSGRRCKSCQRDAVARYRKRRRTG